MGVQESKKALLDAAKELYEASGRHIKCLYPWVLVRVLPKEQMWKNSGIILPDIGTGAKAQNKPVHEGIVLETWKPFWKQLRKDSKESGQTVTSVKKASGLTPGDHILFPSWSGQPPGFLDDKEFRLIQEISDYNPSPVPFAKLEYDAEPVQSRIQALIDGSDSDCKNLAQRIMDGYYVIPKNLSSKTVSGR